jgi:diaminopimelate epimerase
MKIDFFKYQGTGNDFIMIDDRANRLEFSDREIQQLCDRRFGIGADGLILIRNHATADFEMVYYNSDGSQSFCGNGSRCALAFAKKLGLFQTEATFLAIDGMHAGKASNETYSTKMGDVFAVESINKDFYVHTGSPHYIRWENDLDQLDIVPTAHEIRYNERFKKEGTNVNFVQDLPNNMLRVRTYERGVENETLSCGTGVTAVAIANAVKKDASSKETRLKVQGGELIISFDRDENAFTNIWLTGPAKFVFSGTIDSSLLPFSR